jgi:outer membrane protein OmpA-like peptidoglycan-associated protein
MTKKLAFLLLSGLLSSSPLWAKKPPTLRLVIAQPYFSPNNDQSEDVLAFIIESEGFKKISNWELRIEDSGGVTRRIVISKDKLPEMLLWDGLDDRGAECAEGNYQVSLTVWDSKLGAMSAPSETIRVDLTSPIASLIRDKNSPAGFFASAVDLAGIDTWKLEIQNSTGQPVYIKTSSGPVLTHITLTPEEITKIPDPATAILFITDNAGNSSQSLPVNLSSSKATAPPKVPVKSKPSASLKYMQMTAIIAISDLFGPKADRSSDLKPESAAVLSPLARTLVENPLAKAIILGHVDSRKNAASLSRHFAWKTYSFFSKQSGIDIKNVTVKSLGYKFPLTRGKTASDRARNRRIEIQIFIPKIETP